MRAQFMYLGRVCARHAYGFEHNNPLVLSNHGPLWRPPQQHVASDTIALLLLLPVYFYIVHSGVQSAPETRIWSTFHPVPVAVGRLCCATGARRTVCRQTRRLAGSPARCAPADRPELQNLRTAVRRNLVRDSATARLRVCNRHRSFSSSGPTGERTFWLGPSDAVYAMYVGKPYLHVVNMLIKLNHKIR